MGRWQGVSGGKSDDGELPETGKKGGRLGWLEGGQQQTRRQATTAVAR